ncbi:DUF6942 family protein [Gallaecimonas mangrovi]|uniref:DUF6942 family protein n=1 Tax=Gallaecimonas mangrovi TaxID=2291597 RepID=UPI000E200BFB|nr:hypothetical protein [Gallaecimonas mangrovi]
MQKVGLGGTSPRFCVFIANRPPLDEYQHDIYRPMRPGEIADIARQTGNHWRKIFNVYAKLAYLLDNDHCRSWQQLRDEKLLQEGSHYALLFNAPDLKNRSPQSLILGKGYADNLGLTAESGGPLDWDMPGFALDARADFIVCPYFDYRQLSNIKLLYLKDLIARNQMLKK